ncbi:MAG: STAS domain-containing protein [Pirellulaceae bacterium]|jgi:anti-anti-sigma factor
MNIQSRNIGDRLVMQLDGRLDASWADYVGNAIESAIQQGEHRIDLDLAQVNYVSSAGISVLLKYRKRLSGVKGELRVCNPVENVLELFRLTKLDKILMGKGEGVATSSLGDSPKPWEAGGVQYESYPVSAPKPFHWEWFGRPDDLATGSLRGTDARTVRMEADHCCLGLGAFGVENESSGPRKTEEKYGESLGVAGVAIEQATDDSSVPDFQIAQGAMVPELKLLYGGKGSGEFPHLIRFEAGKSDRRTIRFSELLEQLLQTFHYESLCVTMVAEATSVVGASLLRSPSSPEASSLWSFPEIRDWISFTSEQHVDRKLVLLLGIAQRSPEPSSQPFVRPICQSLKMLGHFHAAVFPYRPIAKGMLPMRETIHQLFATDAPRSVVHLLADERPIEGVGETELMRGACWCSEITQITGP